MSEAHQDAAAIRAKRRLLKAWREAAEEGSSALMTVGSITRLSDRMVRFFGVERAVAFRIGLDYAFEVQKHGEEVMRRA